MKTIFVSGSDTAVGKTWVVGTLAARFAVEGYRIQIVKPIESGAENPDAIVASRRSGVERIEAYTLRSLKEPIAPVSAADRDGVCLQMESIISEIGELPKCDIRIIEGAGSIATPIDEQGRDWADFAKCIEATITVLVVDFKLGAIGQSRLSQAYASNRGITSGIWLNQTALQDDVVLESTLAGLESCSVPIWGIQKFDDLEAEWRDFPKIA